MENSNNKNSLLLIATLLLILISSAFAFWFLSKNFNLNTATKNVSNTSNDTATIIDQKGDFSIKLKNIDKNNKKFNYITIEYNKNSENYILKTFFDETYPEPLGETDYSISYLSDKYLTVRQSGWELYTDYLFDLNKLQEIESSVRQFGTFKFYENDKYVLFEGMGRIRYTGLTVEFIDDKPVYDCALSKEETFDVTVKNGVASFTELALTEDAGEKITNKSIDINDFCKGKKSE